MFKLSAYTSLLFLVMIAVTVACTAGNAAGVAIPGPTVDAAKAAKSGEQTVVVAGGCFWGIQAVFQHVKGVKSATSGYSGGDAKAAQYERWEKLCDIQVTQNPNQPAFCVRSKTH